MAAHILYYAGWDIVLFILLSLVYLPVISFRNTIRENNNGNIISTVQIIFEFITLFILLKIVLSMYGHMIFITGN